jgi:hypothetical protein
VKITNLSLAAIAVVGMMSVASADVDVKVGGQGVIYYQTIESGGDSDFFKQENSRANAGLQLNLDADLGNGFGLGYQETFLGSLGLENNIVSNTMQTAQANELNSHSMTKLFVTKKIANTTLKLGRQELPKSLSPLAFSEGWNVFKNTFDAAVAINSDIPDTTLVGAYVSRSNGALGANPVGLGDLGAFGDLAKGAINKGAYMLTVANKSIKQAPITLSYYKLEDILGGEAGSAIWADVQVDASIPVKFGLQGGQISPENNMDETTAMGAKITGKAGPVSVKLAYSSVDDGALSVQNTGTGTKTPLYTQMVFNQNHISRDADTVVLQAKAPVGPGTLIAQYDMTTDNANDGSDYTELDVIYKFKALGTTMLAAYVMADDEAWGDPKNIVRLWTRYNF